MQGHPSSLMSTGEATHGVVCPVLGSPVQDRHGHSVRVQPMATKFIKELKNQPCEEKLREQGL